MNQIVCSVNVATHQWQGYACIYGINEMQSTSLKGHHLELLVQCPCQHHPVRDKTEILLNEVVQGLYTYAVISVIAQNPPPSSPVNLARTPVSS